jgi:2-dehydro-3-deoxyphosphogluconate aldolase / (4S)-4-hydroxy-2-oxoglutarate aldolase
VSGMQSAAQHRSDAERAFLDGLSRVPVMAILRGPTGPALVEPALTLFAAGIAFVEISLTTPGACATIEQLAARAPEGARVGAGTVLTVEDVAEVASAGAQFVVTPAMAESVGESVRRGLPVAAGALTPTEVLAAHRLGATAVKIFPASSVGPGYLTALRGPFPGIALLAVGGIGIPETTQYLRAGALAVGVGSPLLGDAGAGGDLAALRDRALAYVAAARDVGV